jgi:hypothetical protein
MKYYIITMAAAITAAFSYQAGVIMTTRRVDSVLLHQSRLKDRDHTYRRLAAEFPEGVD